MNVNSKTLIAIIIFVSAFFIITWNNVGVPGASDDALYIDAAYSFQTGNYKLKHVSFHHYLRWPVIIPLALFIKILGPSPNTYSIFVFSIYLLIALCSLFILKSYKVKTPLALLSLLTPILVPVNVLSPQVLSEPISVLLCLLIILCHRKNHALNSKSYYFFIGLLIALFVNCTHINMLYIPLMVSFFAYEKSKDLISYLKCSISIVLFSLVFYLCIMSMEYIFFDDFFLQYNKIMNWHFKHHSLKSNLQKIFSTQDYNHFILGYLVILFKTNFAFCCTLVCGILFLNFRFKKINYIYLHLLLTFLTLEFFSLFVVSKYYIRFAAVLIVLATLTTIVSLLNNYKNTYSNKYLTPLMVIFALLFFYSTNIKTVSLRKPTGEIHKVIKESLMDYEINNINPKFSRKKLLFF